jgi:predicted ATPase/DNA-binding SARP family transcriptional activator
VFEVSVLGRVEARADGRHVEITSRTQRILLAALAQARGAPVPTDRLAWLVWGDTPPHRAAQSLKSHLSRLRRTLGEDVIAARSPGYALDLPPEAIDVHRFEAGIRDARSLQALDEALALWRGTPFGELADNEQLAGEVARLTEQHLTGRLRRAELLADAGRHDDAIGDLRALAAEVPLDERARIALVTALHRAGRQADAIAAADRYRADAAEVGLEPSGAFLAAERAVFAQPPSDPSTAPRPSPPARLDPLVGRDDELDRVCGLLEERRLVTLVGPGGVGKTALAMEVARRMGERASDEVWIATLAEVEDREGVLPAIVRSVGAPTTQPLDASLCGYLTNRAGILVLDNTEHLSTPICRVADQVLSCAAEVRILTTGRQPLGLAGEAVVAVTPLDPDAAHRLLRERCHDAGGTIEPHDADLVARICERLDHLPLAIEMAAARLRALSLADLDRHLDQRLGLLRSGRDGRHETLGDVVAWSHGLLDDEQRTLFDQLAVFAGPFDLEAASAVHGSHHTAGPLADLVDRSLVQVVPDQGRGARYHLLETVRTFAGERLAASPKAEEVAGRFVAHHVELAERIGEGVSGPDEQRWVSTFELHTPNLQATHARVLEHGDVDAAVRLATAPYHLIYQRLRADIGAWADATLPLARAAGHPATDAVVALVALDRLNRGLDEEAHRLLVGVTLDPVARQAFEIHGDLFLYRGELEAAHEQYVLAEHLAEEAGDRFTTWFARISRAMPLGYGEHLDDALAILGVVRPLVEDAGLELLAAWCDYATAEALVEHDPVRSLDLVDRAVARADQGGWRMLAGVARLTASSLRARSADPADAVAGFERLLRHWRALGDQVHQWTTMRNLVELLVRLDALEAAATILGAVDEAPTPSFGPERDRLDGARERIHRRLGERADLLISTGRTLDLDAGVEIGLAALVGHERPGPLPPATARHPGP